MEIGIALAGAIIAGFIRNFIENYNQVRQDMKTMKAPEPSSYVEKFDKVEVKDGKVIFGNVEVMHMNTKLDGTSAKPISKLGREYTTESPSWEALKLTVAPVKSLFSPLVTLFTTGEKEKGEENEGGLFLGKHVEKVVDDGVDMSYDNSSAKDASLLGDDSSVQVGAAEAA